MRATASSSRCGAMVYENLLAHDRPPRKGANRSRSGYGGAGHGLGGTEVLRAVTPAGSTEQRRQHRFEQAAAPARQRIGPAPAFHQDFEMLAGAQQAFGHIQAGRERRNGFLHPLQAFLVESLATSIEREIGFVIRHRRRYQVPKFASRLAWRFWVRVHHGAEAMEIIEGTAAQLHREFVVEYPALGPVGAPRLGIAPGQQAAQPGLSGGVQ